MVQAATNVPDLDTAGDPQAEIRTGLVVAVVFFVLFLGWAALVRLDAAAYAPGNLVVSGQRQTVQHKEGGVVGQIYVKEGQQVSKGQVLLQLAAADVIAQERSLSTRMITLLAQRARLEAEQLGSSEIKSPLEFATLTGNDRAESQAALDLQRSQMQAHRSLLSSERGVYGQRSAQATSQGRGYGEQVAAAREQIRLIDEQLDSLRPLAEKGFVRKSQLIALESSKASLIGQIGQYSASIDQSRSAAGEGRLLALEAESNYRVRVASELKDVQSDIDELRPQLDAARDRLDRTAIRAPATGKVVGLSVFTPGGVISPGQRLMDIVPDAAPLQIEARISPDNADDVEVGQKAQVRFQGLHDRSVSDLNGTVDAVSADSFLDERTGQPYFRMVVVVPHRELLDLQRTRETPVSLRAGLPVEVLIPLRKRSALQYALEPMLGAFWKSFREE